MKFTFISTVLWCCVTIAGSLASKRTGRQYEWHDSFQVPGPYIPPKSVMDVSLIIDNKSKPKHYALLADAVHHYRLDQVDSSQRGLTIDIDSTQSTSTPDNEDPLVASHSAYETSVAHYDDNQLQKPKVGLTPAMLVLLPIIMLIGLVATLSFVSVTGTSVSSIIRSSSNQQQQQESNSNNNNDNNGNNANSLSSLMLLSSLSEMFSSNSNYPLIVINATGRNFFDRYQ